jgi:hypothetical protein
VPLPGSGLLLLGAAGGLAALRHRKVKRGPVQLTKNDPRP